MGPLHSAPEPPLPSAEPVTDPTSKGRPMGIRIGYAAGAFDLFHVGHLNLLRHAKSECDFLIAGVVSDDLLEKNKGKRPIIPLIERLEIVQSVQFVDRAVAEEAPTKLDMWKQLGFNVFFKGDDWKGTPQGLLLEESFAEVGVKVVYFPYTVHTSSTFLRRTLELLNAPVVHEAAS
jgi:glycerol-3-phosphate cytidylyltransferase